MIARLLEKDDGISVSQRGIAKFLKVYEETQSISRRPGSGRLSEITASVKQIVEQQIQLDDETTAAQLYRMLVENGVNISLRTVRTTLGWTFRSSAYFQLIRDANREKRLDWAHEYRHDVFEDALWIDECTVQ